MIKVKTVAIGNNEEAFIEDNFKDGINIIYSNDNNKGKSILIQSIMYTIGNVAVFPTKPKAFYYKNYYFYLELEINGEEYCFLRKENTICVLHNEDLIINENIESFTNFFDKNIEKLPYFKRNKNGNLRKASLELFYLCFFLGSDSKSTSVIPSTAIKRFNKKDFESMLCGIKIDLKSLEDSYKKVEDKKNLLKQINRDIKIIDRKRKKIKEYKERDNRYVPNCTQKEFDEYKKDLEKINNNIDNKEKEKKRIYNKILKKQGVISQIESVRRNLKVGFLFCSDCQSRNIRYSLSKNGIAFDITNEKTRSKVLNNLRNDIEQLELHLKILDEELGLEQINLNNYMQKNSNISLNDYFYFIDYIKESTKYNEEYVEKNKEKDILIEKINNIEKQLNIKEQDIKQIKKDLENKLRDEYFKIDHKIEGNLDGLCTKSNESFSGSQALFFLYARIMAIVKYFNLQWPIIIDSIRDGEVASSKENLLLEQLKSIDNQIILTATLKDSEYNEEKYIKMENINPIDYSDIPENTLLRSKYVEQFKKFDIEM